MNYQKKHEAKQVPNILHKILPSALKWIHPSFFDGTVNGHLCNINRINCARVYILFGLSTLSQVIMGNSSPPNQYKLWAFSPRLCGWQREINFIAWFIK